MMPPPGPIFEAHAGAIRWSWRSDRHRAMLPDDLDARAMTIRSDDRLHAKQGRSTCRVRFDSPEGPLVVYLKRHHRLPWPDRLLAMLRPHRGATPAWKEWRHLRRAQGLGIPVPEPVAAGELSIGWGRVEGFLMIEELEGCQPLHEAIPAMQQRLGAVEFESWKRALIDEMAALTARLHGARAFHRDLYLCHYYIDPKCPEGPLYLIDLHRLKTPRFGSAWWRWKDLAQLLFSTIGVEGVTGRDRVRFWRSYRSRIGLCWPGWERRMILWRSARYLSHNDRKARRDG